MKIALIGYGKMGKTIEAIALERGHIADLKIDIDSIGDFTKENLLQCDVAIEFTGPHSAKENILKCLDAGMNQYISKPFKLEEIDAVLRNYTLVV